jgi:signal transduction histidine kinase
MLRARTAGRVADDLTRGEPGTVVTRKLTIRTKLAATLAVPLVALASFAIFQVRDAYELADVVDRQAQLATSATGPAGVLAALETEREYHALWAIGKQDVVDKDTSSGDITSLSNEKLAEFEKRLRQTGGAAADNYQAVLSSVRQKLTSLRKDAERFAAKEVTPETAKRANQIFDRYTELIVQLLDVDERSGHEIDDAELRSGAELLNAIARQSDVEKQIAVKAIVATLAQDAATALQVQRLAGLQTAGDTALRVRGVDAYARAIVPTLTSKRRADIVERLQAVGNDPLHANVDQLFATVTDSTELWRVPQTGTEKVVDQRAGELRGNAQGEQRYWVAVTIASLLLALAAFWLASKWVTRPLRSLAKQARAMAQERLPRAVEAILATPVDQPVETPDVEPVRVRAGGEVADVAAALNSVQKSAIELAVEQARLRGNVAEAFVNLGRRNQNLLSRQLEFITQLENDESDPETLEHLFRLDHLATRMRRNAESLLVLAGHEPPRTWSAPVAVADVVRGALGEVEGYQRVRLRRIDDAEVDGAAAVDVSHVVAELVENALSFSPPTTTVDVYGRADEYGYIVTIADQGIGMPPEDLERANRLIASVDTRTFAPSRFLGHYVVAQLAARHGLSVQLTPSPTGGLAAMVSLPPELLGREAPPVEHAPPVPLDVDEHVERPPGALPRRGPSAGAVPAAPAEAVPAAPAEAVAAAPRPEREERTPLTVVRSEPDPDLPRVVAEPPAAPRVPPPAPPLAVPGAPSSPPVAKPVAQPVAEPVAEAVSGPADPPPAEPVAAPAPPAPARPRIGIGTFADLRGTAAAPAPPVAGTRAAPASEAAPGPAHADAPAAEAAAAPGPDRAAAFAEVAHAVDAATAAPAGDVESRAAAGSPPPTAFAEDFLPQKLPKRGRRASRLTTPWARQKPAGSAASPPVTAAGSASRPVEPAAVAPVPPAAPSRGEAPPPGALHFPPGGPALAATNVDPRGPAGPETAAGAPAPAPEGDDRFAFFAAFRAAAERAREEAGIDDRRVGP